MPAPKPKRKQTETKKDGWEDGYYETNEKKQTLALLKTMHLPAYNEEFEPSDLDKICEKLCLGLKFKLSRWERFLTD